MKKDIQRSGGNKGLHIGWCRWTIIVPKMFKNMLIAEAKKRGVSIKTMIYLLFDTLRDPQRGP